MHKVRVVLLVKAIAAMLLLLCLFTSKSVVAQSNIVYAEYYLDNDPGFNQATPVAITPGVTLANIPVTIDVNALQRGAHFFGLRARSADGVWSMTYQWFIFRPYVYNIQPSTLSNITRVEYYIDNDPGIGKGTTVAAPAQGNISDATFNINPNTLTPGVHTIGTRAQDAQGGWSKTNFWLFYKPYTNLAQPTTSNINYVEYFVDQDPGIGQATPVSITPGLNLSDVSLPANIVNSAAGSHIIGARAKDAAGKWSFTNYWLFIKPYTNLLPAARPNITGLEYYLDYDPGYGKGTSIPVTPGQNLQDLTFNVDISSLVGGTHFVSVRARDANGSWSKVNSWEFTKPGTSPTLTSLVSTTTLCAGGNINVGYQLSAPVAFKTDNRFVAQLSDVNGSFTNPIEIGSVAATSESGSFTCKIPDNAAQSGSYRIRVITTNQTVIGNNNGNNITIYSLPAIPVLTPKQDTTVCQGNPLTLTGTVSGGSPQWLFNNTPITSATSATYSVPNAGTANAGAYRLRVTNASVCHVFSPSINVTINTAVPPTASISPNGNVGVCLGGSRTLSSSVATGNQWYRNGVLIPNATGQTYEASTAGTYTIETSNGSCKMTSSNSAVVVVGVGPTKPDVTAEGPTSFCQNGGVTFTSSAFSSNQWFRNGQAISGATNTTYYATQSGWYRVMVTNGSCEIFSDSTEVVVNPTVTPSVSLAASTNNVPASTPITFTATPVNGGALPTYVFRVNNTIVQTGTANTYTTATLANGAVVNCTMTSNAPCLGSNNPGSNSVTITLLNPVTVAGRIYHPTGAVIPTVSVRISGGTTDSIITDGNGRYSSSMLQQRNYIFAPNKNNDLIKAKGVNVLDVLQVQKHILAQTPLNSPYKIIAADVNNDASVNIFDVVAVKRLILGIDTTFSGGRLWSFVDSTQTFGNPANPFPYNSFKTYSNLTTSQANQSYLGVKLGDVNFDWTPTSGENRVASPRKVLQLYYDTVYAENGDAVRLRIKARNFTELMGVQFTIGFNGANLTYTGVENKQLPFEHNDRQAAKGAVSFIWADAANNIRTLYDGAVLFDIVLKKTGSIEKDDIYIHTSYTPAIGFSKNNEPVAVQKGEGVILNKVSVNSAEMFTISPNPSDGRIRVAISAKEAKRVILVVTDAAGRAVLRKPVDVIKGNNIIPVNLKEAGAQAAGLYYIKATGLDGEPVKEMLIVN